MTAIKQLLAGLVLALVSLSSFATEVLPTITVYKSPT